MMFHFAAPIVDWTALGKAAAAALVSSIALAVAFSLAVLGTTRSLEMRRAGRGVEASAFGVLGILCAAVCVAAIVGGIIVMSSK